MQLHLNPSADKWAAIAERPVQELDVIIEKVRPIMLAVKQDGDDALRQYTQQFDGVVLKDLQVTAEEIAIAMQYADPALVEAINTAKANITRFHAAQLKPEEKIETMPGVLCWRQMKPIDTVGLYIPGGTAPLFSTILMLAIPASLAGCKKIVLCTPPAKDGSIHPAILLAAHICGVTNIYKAGGAQAIAAMTYGTSTIPAVQKIFGPGNQYVTAAKQLAQLQGLAIDMPAGPSEVCVWADETAVPKFVAADLLSQAEHGADSQVMFITNSADFSRQVAEEMITQLQALPRMQTAQAALDNSRTVIFDNAVHATDFINQYAPEHLIICCKDAEQKALNIHHAGSIFLGNYTPESAGDYASGTNHTLPTNGYARAWSGVSVDSFVKKITVQHITQQGLTALGNTITTMAEAEGLQAHSNAVKIRLTP